MPIHVLEKQTNFVKLGNNIWECGWWKLKEEQVQNLIGSEIYFHKKKLEPSFYGGTIRSYRFAQEGDYEGQVIFEFEFQQKCRNIKTTSTGWSREAKIVAPAGDGKEAGEKE